MISRFVACNGLDCVKEQVEESKLATIEMGESEELDFDARQDLLQVCLVPLIRIVTIASKVKESSNLVFQTSIWKALFDFYPDVNDTSKGFLCLMLVEFFSTSAGSKALSNNLECIFQVLELKDDSVLDVADPFFVHAWGMLFLKLVDSKLVQETKILSSKEILQQLCCIYENSLDNKLRRVIATKTKNLTLEQPELLSNLSPELHLAVMSL